MVVAWIVTLLAFAYALIAVVFILVPSTISVDRLTYELTQFIPLAIIILLTVIFYVMGHRDTRNQDVYVDLPEIR